MKLYTVGLKNQRGKHCPHSNGTEKMRCLYFCFVIHVCRWCCCWQVWLHSVCVESIGVDKSDFIRFVLKALVLVSLTSFGLC